MQYNYPSKYFNSNNINNQNFDIPKEFLNKELPSYRLKYLKEFIMNLPLSARVLDLGSGTGKASRIIKSYRPDIEVYALDISNLKNYFPDKIIFTQGSAEELEKIYEKEFFDAVISLHLIEHLIFPNKMMSGIYYILKKKGKIFIETPNWTRIFVPFSYMFFYNDYTHIRPFSVFSISKLFLDFDIKPLFIKTVSTFSFLSRTNKFLEKKNFISNNIIANKKRGLLSRLLGKIIDPFIKDVIIAIGEKE